MFKIDIKQWPIDVYASKNKSILEDALRAGIPYPHNCRSGECGECKTTLLQGQVDHDPYLISALPEADRDKGMVLACRARPTTDIKIAWEKEVTSDVCIPVKRYKARVMHLEQLAHNVTCVRLDVKGSQMAFVAGQYVSISFNRYPARSYSMANHPDITTLEFYIRHVPDGLVSSYVASDVKVGDKLNIEGPYGTSYLCHQHTGNIIAAAGGTGLAPMLSIIRKALDQQSDRIIQLYFGVQDEVDIYSENEIQELEEQFSNFSAKIILSAPTTDSQRSTGFVHDVIDAEHSNFTNTKIYAAGPPIMIDSLTAMATAKGISTDDILSDPYTANGDSTVAEAKSGLFGRLLGR